MNTSQGKLVLNDGKLVQQSACPNGKYLVKVGVYPWELHEDTGKSIVKSLVKKQRQKL